MLGTALGRLLRDTFDASFEEMSSSMIDNESEIRKSFSLRKVLVPVLIGVLVASGLLYRDVSKVRFHEVEQGDHAWVDENGDGAVDLDDAAEFQPVQAGTGNYERLHYTKLLQKINWSYHSFLWLLLALVFTALRDLGYIFRIRHLTNRELSWRSGFNVIMLWEFASALTPSVVGGSGIAMFILSREKISLGRSTATVMVTAWLDELFYVCMVPVVLLFTVQADLFPESLDVDFYGLPIRGIFWVGYAFFVFLAAVISYAIFFQPRAFKYILLQIFRIRFLRKWRAKVVQVGNDIITSSKEFKGKRMKFWFIAAATTLLSLTSRFLVLNCIIAAFFEVNDHLLVYARQLVMWVIMLIGVTPGSSGIAEIAFDGFFKDFLTVAGVGTVLALIWRLFTYYIYLFMGIVIFPRWLRSTSSNKSE